MKRLRECRTGPHPEAMIFAAGACSFGQAAFNNMAQPQYGEGAATMSFADDDAAANAVAGRLALHAAAPPLR
jgi:hypothetical protein